MNLENRLILFPSRATIKNQKNGNLPSHSNRFPTAEKYNVLTRYNMRYLYVYHQRIEKNRKFSKLFVELRAGKIFKLGKYIRVPIPISTDLQSQNILKKSKVYTRTVFVNCITCDYQHYRKKTFR